jgi:hypothetical protein
VVALADQVAFISHEGVKPKQALSMVGIWDAEDTKVIILADRWFFLQTAWNFQGPGARS